MPASASTAIGQRSLGDPSLLFPLYPPLLSGCPRTSGPDMQYPLEIDYDYTKVASGLFPPASAAWSRSVGGGASAVNSGLSLGEGGTALVQDAKLGDWVGLDGPILLKDESRNPTWSHKDRLNYCIVGAAVAYGARGIAVASTGNHGASAAAYARRAGLRCVVISTPTRSPHSSISRRGSAATSFSCQVPNAGLLCGGSSDETGFMPASNLTRFHTGNPFGPEGYKTIAYELFVQLGERLPGTVVLPTGYGELLFGVAKGFRELRSFGLIDCLPRIVSAEPGVRAPLASAMARNVPAAEVSGPASLAAGIACVVSSYRAARALRETGGRALTFTEETLQQAVEALAQSGFWQEYSGAAGIAALREARRRGERSPSRSWPC